MIEVEVSKLKEHPFSGEVFNDLPHEDYEALKADIVANGIKTPLDILPDFTMLDGHQRKRIATESGLEKVPCKIRNLKSDLEVREWIILSNLLRRQLKPEERALAIAKLSEVYEWPTGADHKSRKYQEAKNASGSRDVIEQTAEKTGVKTRTVIMYRAYARAVKEMPKLKNKPIAFAIKQYHRIKKRRKLERASAGQDIKNLILGDALDELKKLGDESVDCVIIDPPYGIEFRPTSSRWSEVKGDNKSIFPYLREVGMELYRVMKRDTHLYCFCGWKDSYCPIYSAIERAGFTIADLIVWVKDQRTTGPDFTNKYAHFHEFIIYARKGNRYLNKDFSPDVLKFGVVKNGSSAVEKPVELLKYLIENSTVKGEIVLDCFVGTGATLVAAEESERNWIGTEIAPEQYEIARARILELRKNKGVEANA